ncbi:MAG: hypothetical protein Kow0047_02230 [Anaerolineae bacterium]
MQRKRGWLWLTTGFLMAVLAGVLTFRLLTQAVAAASEAQEIDMSPAVVALRDIPLRAVVDETAITVKQIPTELIPAGAARSIAEVVGKVSRQEIAAGEIVLTTRLVDPNIRGRDIAFVIPDDKVVFALPANDLLSKVGFLKAGDRVDLLFSLTVPSTGDDKVITINAIQNVEIMGIVAPPSLSAPGVAAPDPGRVTALSNEGVLLFAVSAQDALTLKFLKDSGAIMDVALRAPTGELLLETEPVDLMYLADRYQFIDLLEQSAAPKPEPTVTSETTPEAEEESAP